MKAWLSKYPVFVLLLPVFFVLHGYLDFIGFADFTTVVPLLFTYLVCTSVLWLLLVILYKNTTKAALICVLLTGIYLFFGAVFDFLKAHSPWKFLYKYSVLLSCAIVVAALIIYSLQKTKRNFSKTVFFLNLLFLVYIFIDLGNATFGQNKSSVKIWQGPENAASGIIPNSVKKPDIYLLVFDGYSSTYALKEYFNFNNRSLDSFLTCHQFHLIPYSRSNYSTTSFSMASTFNMDYLYWLDAGKWITKKDYARSTTQIFENKAMQFLSNNGYEIVNHSIFDIKGNPSVINNDWKSIYSNIISEGTLGRRLVTEFRWWLNSAPVINKLLPFLKFGDQYNNNLYSIKAVMDESAKRRTRPRFVYGHFLLPHIPYYRDKNDKPRPYWEYNDPKWYPGPDNYYTEYIQWTNNKLTELINTIKSNTKGEAVIILMSDHGYHMGTPDEKKYLVWNNLNAWYLPDGQYQQLNDSITNVNQFRILFNSLFQQQYPIMKDSFMRIYH